MAKVIRVVFIILCLSPFLYSQHNNIQFEQISLDQGLSQTTIHCIFQDSKGFMWFGTEDGLNKYDGYKFTVYKNDPFNSQSISSNVIYSICEDDSGFIWVGTKNGGLNRFNQTNESFISLGFDNNIFQGKRDIVTALFFENSGKLWLGTDRSGLYRIDLSNYKITHFTIDKINNNSKRFYSVNVICKDKQNNLWIGTNNGLKKFDPATERLFEYDNNKSLSNKVVNSITQDEENNLWVGTNHGLNKLNLKNDKVERFFQPPGTVFEISTMHMSKTDQLWIIANKKTLLSYDIKKNEINSYEHDSDNQNTLSDKSLESIFIDYAGIIWIGTHGAGINKVYPAKFFHYKIDVNDPSREYKDFICAISEDNSGNFWIGTHGNGVYKTKRDEKNTRYLKVLKHYSERSNSPYHISSDVINSIHCDASGNIWIGSDKGLDKVVQSDLKANAPQKTVHYNNYWVFDIYEDTSKTVWIITGGIIKYDSLKDSFIRYLYNSSSIQLKSIIPDKNKTFWIGSTAGLYKFDPENKNVSPFVMVEEIQNSLKFEVKSMHKDNFGMLWIATTSGLIKYDDKNNIILRYTQKDGLPGNLIYGMLEDENGNLWISTNNGLSKFLPQTGAFINFDVNDGLQSKEFNTNAFYKTKNGEMIFGGINGINIFHPDKIPENKHVPAIQITDFRIFNKSVAIQPDSLKADDETFYLPKHISNLSEITLSNMESVFSFEFAALDYHNPLKNKYAYKMDGVDPDWVYTDARRRFATYTQLNPGEYLFRVKGSNNDGIWNEQGSSLKIIITPPWWKSSWAYMAYVLITGLIGLLAWRFQTNRLKMQHELQLEHMHAEKLEEVDRIKSRFFTNVSHEFRTPLTLILGPAKQMLTGEFIGNIKEQAKIIVRNGERLLTLINQILDISKLDSGAMKLEVTQTDVYRFITEIAGLFSAQAQRKKIDFLHSASSTDMRGFVDRDKTEKIICNLLSNAFKYTPEGGKVEIELSAIDPPEALINNADNGITRRLKKDKKTCIHIVISNTGTEIPADKKEKIFDRFYQVNESANSGEMGSGIGLALTKELVEAHRGSITLKTGDGKNTFSVALPIAKENFSIDELADQVREVKPIARIPEQVAEAEENAMQDRSAVPKKSTPLILIVEDNPDMTRYISNFLENEYRLICAENGAIGWEMAFEHYPDLIISDVMMPEMDGFELCKKLKTDQETSHIPIILLTAKADMESKIAGLTFGADDYLSKPFDALELKSRISNIIEQRRRLMQKFQNILEIQPSEAAASEQDEQFIKRLLDVFESHAAESDFDTSEFANEIGMSRSSLYRKLQALTNQPAHEFLRTLRIKRAAQLLNQADISVTEAAYAVGFKNLSHFSKIFQEHFGESPKKFANKKH